MHLPGTSPSGCAYGKYPRPATVVSPALIVFTSRMNDSEQRTDPYVPTVAVEEILMDGVANFMSVAEHQLNLELPLDVAVGLEGVEGFMLAISRPLYFQELAGPILAKRIDDRFRIDSYTSDPFDLLLPLFKKIYDEAGYERPDVRHCRHEPAVKGISADSCGLTTERRAARVHSGSSIPWRRQAAVSVFLSRHAIVIGPTPPGTGVIQPAFSTASSKQTSPTNLVFSPPAPG